MRAAVEKAKRAAADLSKELLHGGMLAGPLTLGRLVELFRREDLRDMTGQHRREVERELDLLVTFLGSGFAVENLGPTQWNALRRARSTGEIDARGNHISEPSDRRTTGGTTVKNTLKAVRQLCRFGRRYRRPDGSPLLASDPTEGLAMPSNPDPRRPLIDDTGFERMLENALHVHPYMPALLTLAGETGRRIGAVVALRYSDWLPDRGTYGSLRWRWSSDKLGKEWVAPVTPACRTAVEEIMRERPGIGEAYMFPAPESAGHVDVTLCSRWWR